MKKTYISPTLQVVTIEQSQMLCASRVTGLSGGDGMTWTSEGISGDGNDY